MSEFASRLPLTTLLAEQADFRVRPGRISQASRIVSDNVKTLRKGFSPAPAETVPADFVAGLRRSAND